MHMILIMLQELWFDLRHTPVIELIRCILLDRPVRSSNIPK